MAEERLQKILARAGIASRRKAEEIITAGRVRVDGKVVIELGAKANPRRAVIELDGKKLEPEPLCYGVLHKPRGMVTTLSDPEGRPTAQLILRQVGLRVVPVGRLDFNTSGALLFTNDGDFAQAIQHAKGKAPKVYAAKVTRPVDSTHLSKWSESIEIEGKGTNPAAVRVLRRDGEKSWIEVTIQEGRNHQVRRLGDHAGTPVDRLARLSHAGITTDGLRPGEWRFLSMDELKEMKKQFGFPVKVRPAPFVSKPPRGGAVLRVQTERSGEPRPRRPGPADGRPGQRPPLNERNLRTTAVRRASTGPLDDRRASEKRAPGSTSGRTGRADAAGGKATDSPRPGPRAAESRRKPPGGAKNRPEKSGGSSAVAPAFAGKRGARTDERTSTSRPARASAPRPKKRR